MKIADVDTFEDLEKYLREFHNFHDEPAPYDFNGAFHLLLAILENLARHSTAADVDEHIECKPWFTDQQLRFLQQLDRLR